MLKIDVTKMKTTKHIHQVSTNTINEIKSTLWMLLRHQVYILNCTASYLQGAAYRLTLIQTLLTKMMIKIQCGPITFLIIFN